MSSGTVRFGRVLSAPRPAADRPAAVVISAPTAVSIISVVGAALATVGWLDVLLNFYPLRIGNPDWEFGVASVVVDSLALGTLGFGLLLFGAAWRGTRWILGALCAAGLTVAVGLIGMMALYALAFPVVWRAADDALQGSLLLAVVKTGTIAMVYLVLYGWLCAVAWRSARSAGRAP